MFNVKDHDFYYELRALPFIEEIALFGSRAKNINRKKSDIDLAIRCPKASEEDWQKVIDIIQNSDVLLKIDCIRIDTLCNPVLLQQIDKSKAVLFKRVPNNYEWYEVFLSLGEALEKFNNVLAIDIELHQYAIEATIQVFEYSFELYWKLLQKICKQEGLEADSPRSALQQAYTMSLIDNESTWLDMLKARSLMSHVYHRPTANRIYKSCQQYYVVMQDNYLKLKERFKL